ncbi:MAG TPA: HTTM domain-containing protein, partial [Kofleriaceae bacterium]
MLAEVYAILARPEPVLGLALGRIALGLVLAYDGLRMLREHDAWYGKDALRPPRSVLPPALDAFAWAERLGGSSRAVLQAIVASAALFACGFATPVAGALLLVCLIAVIARNPFVAYGGDAFGCAVLVLLLCAPCDDAMSIDRLIADGTLGLSAQASPWGGQLLRVEVAAMYLGNFLAKWRSPAWRRGIVMFDLLRNRNFARAGVPRWLTRRDVARFATWGALAAELAFGPALLFGPTAPYACIAAIVFHLAIALLIDVHLFSAVMIAALVACWPMGAGTLPVPSLDPSHAAALVLALGYVAWVLLADLELLGRLGAVRGWRM